MIIGIKNNVYKVIDYLEMQLSDTFVNAALAKRRSAFQSLFPNIEDCLLVNTAQTCITMWIHSRTRLNYCCHPIVLLSHTVTKQTEYNYNYRLFAAS